MRKVLSAILFLPILFLFSVLSAQPPVISYQPVITGLKSPVDIVNAGDGSNRLFIVQQQGIIKVWNGTTIADFINLGSSGANIISAGGERGLLSMVFHPDYNGTTNRFFYVYYTDPNGNIAISRYQTTAGNPNTGDVATGELIITIPHPGQSNHNGGKLNFGLDGYLYFATGDGGGGNDVPNNAQNGRSLLGKMIRIDVNQPGPAEHPNYSIPADNPYVNDPEVEDAVWALGLRNPFRWSFDRATGNMWIGDVGQGSKEEINFRNHTATGPVNYGWRCYEGSISTPGVPDCNPANYVPPVYDYNNPSSGSSAVTGGYVYRGTEYPAFQGYYMAADVYSGTVYLLWPNNSGGFASASQTGLTSFIVGFGEAEDGTLYAASLGTNTVYKIVATGGTVLPATLKTFTVIRSAGHNEVAWATSSEQGVDSFWVEVSTDSLTFQPITKIKAAKNATGSNYSYNHTTIMTAPLFYRLAIVDDDGLVTYSAVVKVLPQTFADTKVYPTFVQNHTFYLNLAQPAVKLQIVDGGGRIVFEKSLSGLTGITTINLPILAKGIYIARVIENDKAHKQKIWVE